MFELASSKHGVTGEVLLQFLEARLDNTIYRMGVAPTRRAARQLVSHRHILVNGILNNVPSALLKPGDMISVRGKSQHLDVIRDSVNIKSDVRKFPWLEWNPDKMEGKFIEYPERENIPEKINEQLIVELYSK
jgi:small subunit ribosomal protein S4